MAISYGSFSFPSPSPIFAIGDSPLYVGGAIDSSLSKITLVGSITGNNLASLSLQKKQMISGLLSEYQTLSVEGESFPFCKPTNIGFSDSDLTTFLPYSVEFERHDSKSFSQYYGITNPVDSWAFQEQQSRVVQATHSVSAQGLKTGSSDPLVSARTFVNSRLSGFNNLSIINPSGIPFLLSKTEEVDRFQNTYSATETYSFSTSRNPITNSAIITANTKINYVKGGESSVSVDGSIVGDITGSSVSSSMFSPSHAKTLAIQAIERSKSSYENSIYGILNNGPETYDYNVNETANKIDFSFTFRDPFRIRKNDVLNEYTVTVAATKDNNTITASIDGTLTYSGPFDIFNGYAIESSPRYLKIVQELNSLNPYNLVREKYSNFISNVGIYEDSNYLNPIPVSESVTKSPFVPSISYSYSYDNNFDLSNGSLKNLQVQITNVVPIARKEIKESNNGFSIQTTANKLLGRIQISSSCDENEDKLEDLKDVAIELVAEKDFQKFEESEETSDSNIAYNVGYYYQ